MLCMSFVRIGLFRFKANEGASWNFEFASAEKEILPTIKMNKKIVFSLKNNLNSKYPDSSGIVLQ